jgi:thiol-disulfide isomerase/thioredoxin
MSGTEFAVAILSIAILALAGFALWALVHLLRQNGRLLLRLEAVEAKLSGGVEKPPPGLPLGSEAPAFSLPNLNGDTISLTTLLEARKPLILLFSEPGCGACDALLPELSQWQRDYLDQLSIVPISRGDMKENRAKSVKYGIRNILIQSDREIAESYQANSTPSAVLVKDGHIESSLAIGADEIRGLVARASLPPPVKAGDVVPSLRLPDLSGEMLDLAKLQSRRTVMLFWNPSCGFCQQMLKDVKKWELDREDNTPELLIISTGGLDDNRKQGFRSRVLLDPYYAASQVFNSAGTPSALMVEQGRVASDVAVGAEAVLALAGAAPAGTHRPI